MDDNNHRFDDEDTGIFIKVKQETDSIYEPLSMTPTDVARSMSMLSSNVSPDSPTHIPNTAALMMKRNVSYGNLEEKNEAKVLVLYTGGTIGMLRNKKGGNN